jgi:hypothetical protein
MNGFYLQNNAAPTPDTCEPCTPIANSNNQGLRCKSATDTQAFGSQFQCTAGYSLVDNTAPTADTCGKCPGIPNSNNEGIICGFGGADPMGVVANGFACDTGYRKIESNALPGYVVSCEKCPSILNSNNVGLGCGDSGVCQQTCPKNFENLVVHSSPNGFVIQGSEPWLGYWRTARPPCSVINGLGMVNGRCAGCIHGNHNQAQSHGAA